MLLRLVDMETTGLPPNAAVCEVGWCDVTGTVVDPTSGLTQWVVGEPRSLLVNPGRTIPPEAMAVHHIRDRDVADAPPIAQGFMSLTNGSPDAFVAHNASFEQAFFAGGWTPWICTLKAGRRLWPDAPSHTNSVLRYWLGLELDDELAMPPHRAGPDAYVTAHILVKALEHATVSDLISWTRQPSILPRVTFGKHRGTEWGKVPLDYLEWCVRQNDMDPDVKATAKHHLQLRRGKAA